MGRKKIDTNRKLPEQKIKSTFTKRKQGVINKVKQLGKLCDVDVALVAFYPRNDAVIAVSHGGTVDEIISKFHEFKGLHLGRIELSEELRMQPQQLQAQQLEQHQMHPNTQVEESRTQPHQREPYKLKQHQMHPNTQMSHLPSTFETGIGMSVGQLKGFYMQAQGNTGSPLGQEQLSQGQHLLPAPPPPDFRDNNYGQ